MEAELALELLPGPLSVSHAGVEPFGSSVFQPDPSAEVGEGGVQLLVLEILLVLLGEELVVIDILAQVSGRKSDLNYCEEKREDEYDLVDLNSDLEQDHHPELGKQRSIFGVDLLLIMFQVNDLIHQAANQHSHGLLKIADLIPRQT